jgi:hypothetical protein
MVYNNHFRQQWVDRGYPGDMGSVAVVPPPGDGYRRLYHFTSAEYAISNIVFKRLKVARFSSLNDPFEMLARKAATFQDQRGFEENRSKFDREHGLLCFSEDWTDPVLWAHYGARHRGICLGFDIEEGFVRKIVYQNERFSDIEARSKTEDGIVELLLYTKFESWKYERKWRIRLKLSDLESEGDLRFYSLDGRVKLTEVIIGVECDIATEAVRSLVSNHHPDTNTVRGRLGLGFFKIVPDEKTIIAKS